MNTLATHLAETNDDPYQFFLTCHGEIRRALPDATNAEVNRDFIRWQNNQSVIPYYVRRHFEREYERAQGLPPGATLPDLYHVGAK